MHKCSDKKPKINSISYDDNGGGSYRFTVSYSEGTHDLDKLTINIDGTTVKNVSVNNSGDYKFNYTFKNTGNHQITATLIDEVLYEHQDSRTINVSESSQSFSMTSPVPGENESPPVKFEWTSYSGADDYEVCWENTTASISPTCKTTNSTSYNANSSEFETLGGNYDVWVNAREDGDTIDTTPTVNFTVSSS